MLFYEHSETRYGLESDMFLQGLYLGMGKPNPTQPNGPNPMQSNSI